MLWNDVGTWQLNAATAIPSEIALINHRCILPNQRIGQIRWSKIQRLVHLGKLLQRHLSYHI
nr:MAG TPA: hypothetical protein [Caudoviricetes sp.]